MVLAVMSETKKSIQKPGGIRIYRTAVLLQICARASDKLDLSALRSQAHPRLPS